MRKIFFFLLSVSSIFSTTYAYEIICPTGSGCDQCFKFTLGTANSVFDTFSPRSGKNEQINLDQSTIYAESLQGASVTPTGNIKSSFNLVGGPGTTPWNWATMNGNLITKGNIPSNINYSNPVYVVKFTTQSYTLNASSQKESGSDVSHSECSYFYIENTVTTPENPIDGQCSSLASFYSSNPRNSSLSGEDLCDAGTAGSVTYSASRERWSYTCSGRNGGTSDSCIVDLEIQDEEDTNDACHVEVTDDSGTVPFSTSILCTGNPIGKTAIVISKNGKILDATNSDSESYDFDDSGVFTVSCYPDVVNDRSNVCKKTVFVSGDCGNGTQESDEQCDDGNATSGDGCNNSCQLEGEGASVCGNAVKEPGEQCDDGNIEDGDECTSLCQDTAPDAGPVFALILIAMLSLAGVGYYTYYRKQKNLV